MSVEHRIIGAGEIHPPTNWSFSNEAARTAAVITDPLSVGAWAYQEDDGSVWRLMGVSPAVWQFMFRPVENSYLDILTGAATVTLQADTNAATPFVLPAPKITALSVGSGIGYDATTGHILIYKKGNYNFRFMMHAVPTGQCAVFYKAATFDFDTGLNPVAFGTSGITEQLSNGQVRHIVFETADHWQARTRLGIYLTSSNPAATGISTTAATQIGTQAVSNVAVRFQLSGQNYVLG